MRIPDTTTTTTEFGSCPACGKPIEATVEFRISGLRIDGRVGTPNVETVGISVSHDCRTKPTGEPTTDEWVEVYDWPDLPEGARIRTEWEKGVFDGDRRFVHRDDLPDNHDNQKENQ